MTTQSTTPTVEACLAVDDTRYVAPDAVFTETASGEQHVGRPAISVLLHHLYHEAFDAHVENASVVVSGERAVVEAEFVGTQLLPFAGVMPSGRDVRIPLAIAYEFDRGLVSRARIYLQVARLRGATS